MNDIPFKSDMRHDEEAKPAFRVKLRSKEVGEANNRTPISEEDLLLAGYLKNMDTGYIYELKSRRSS